MPNSLLDHPGPWSEVDFLALPDDRRIELLDGELLVRQHPPRRHRRLSSWLWLALAAAAPEGLEVLEAINVRVGPDRILVPDIAVTTVSALPDGVADARDVTMVVEIVHPGSVGADRAVKPQVYAAAGVEHYLRIEQGDLPTAVAYVLREARYVEVGRAAEGQRLTLDAPFPIGVDLAELACRNRPAS